MKQKYDYTEKILGNAYVQERDAQGYYRIIRENGESDFLTPFQIGRATVGDVGRAIYYSDGVSYGLVKFQKDETVTIDFEKMKQAYKEKWNTELAI